MEAGPGPGGGELGDPAEVLSFSRRRGPRGTARAVVGLFLLRARQQALGLYPPFAGPAAGLPVSVSPGPTVSSLEGCEPRGPCP